MSEKIIHNLKDQFTGNFFSFNDGHARNTYTTRPYPVCSPGNSTIGIDNRENRYELSSGGKGYTPSTLGQREYVVNEGSKDVLDQVHSTNTDLVYCIYENGRKTEIIIK